MEEIAVSTMVSNGTEEGFYLVKLVSLECFEEAYGNNEGIEECVHRGR